MIPADLPDLMVKVYNLCRVKTIRIAVSAVMDGWKGCCLALRVLIYKNVFSMMFWEMIPVGLEEMYLGGTVES